MINGPTIRCAEAATYSAIFRTARSTIKTWPKWLEQMHAAAQVAVPVERVVKRLFYPDFWDSNSFAANLDFASKGFPDHPKWSPGALDADRVILARARARRLPSPRPLPIQKVAYDCLLKHFYHNSAITFFNRAKVALGLDIDNSNKINFIFFYWNYFLFLKILFLILVFFLIIFLFSQIEVLRL